jgi:hypothetical protein
MLVRPRAKDPDIVSELRDALQYCQTNIRKMLKPAPDVSG